MPLVTRENGKCQISTFAFQGLSVIFQSWKIGSDFKVVGGKIENQLTQLISSNLIF
jgi:hypothetical protein